MNPLCFPIKSMHFLTLNRFYSIFIPNNSPKIYFSSKSPSSIQGFQDCCLQHFIPSFKRLLCSSPLRKQFTSNSKNNCVCFFSFLSSDLQGLKQAVNVQLSMPVKIQLPVCTSIKAVYEVTKQCLRDYFHLKGVVILKM